MRLILTGRFVKTFLSTPSARRATEYKKIIGDFIKNFYPRPPRGGRLSSMIALESFFIISIHALREEGDRRADAVRGGFAISIHALREEGDPLYRVVL